MLAEKMLKQLKVQKITLYILIMLQLFLIYCVLCMNRSKSYTTRFDADFFYLIMDIASIALVTPS